MKVGPLWSLLPSIPTQAQEPPFGFLHKQLDTHSIAHRSFSAFWDNTLTPVQHRRSGGLGAGTIMADPRVLAKPSYADRLSSLS